MITTELTKYPKTPSIYGPEHTHKTLFRTDQSNAEGHSYLTIKANGPYTYAERLGKDSLAFVLYNRDTGFYGLINEYKPPVDLWLTTAFGGSLDKPRGGLSLDEYLDAMVLAEVEEEAGFSGLDPRRDLWYIGRYLCSTQMNQFVYLYVVEVDSSYYTGRKPENETEEASTVEWVLPGVNLSCWKASVAIAEHSSWTRNSLVERLRKESSDD